MTEPQESSGESDDVSFLRTNDIVCLSCIFSAREGGMGTERVSLSAEGFGNRMCYLENVSNKDVPPDIPICMFYIQQALSMRALQEMMSATETTEQETSQGHRTLLYGHAIQLRHVQSNMYLACLSSTSSNDKLAFDVGVQEKNEGESSWWTLHPASKSRSEGEKVRVGDDVILVSVATERYLHISTYGNKRGMVIASFHQTLWNINPICSGTVLMREYGHVFGYDVLRFFHGSDECLTIPETWNDHPQFNMVIYEGGNAVTQARSLWRLELVRTKWHGALVGWEQVFRIRHITTGRYLAVLKDDNQTCQVCLLHRDNASYDTVAFLLLSAKDIKRQGLEEKEDEGMGAPSIKYGETAVFVQHVNTHLWLSYQTQEITKKGIGKVEEKKAIALEEGHMDDWFTFFMAQSEESKSARVIRKCSSVLNRFLKGLLGLQTDGSTCTDWKRVDLQEVLKVMEDLIEYFSQPSEDTEFEWKQKMLKALRNRQDLFQEEGVLNMILDTIDQFSQMEQLSNFSSLIGEENQATWDEISAYLYLLLAAMIKRNHSNCAQFASSQRLNWLFDRLSNPQSAEGILDVLYCVLTESPEALNMISEEHIRSVISLLEKVGRDPKVLDVLRSLCLGNEVAVRSSQNLICDNLLPSRDLLLQTSMVDCVSSVMPNVTIAQITGSAMFTKWYFEAKIEHLEQMTATLPYLRVGWGTMPGFNPFPGPGEKWGANGVGDDMYSFGFDGQFLWTGGKWNAVGIRQLQKGDIIGSTLDLSKAEIRFYLNGARVDGLFRNFNLDGHFFPVMSLSAKVSCRFILGGDQGHFSHGPPKGFSAISEAAMEPVTIGECFSFGVVKKSQFYGPNLLLKERVPFVPKPINTNEVVLPTSVQQLNEKLAENMHELWATTKIKSGWVFAEKRSESKRTHPCLTMYEKLPLVEKNYNTEMALNTLKIIVCTGYHLSFGRSPTRLKVVKLGSGYLMSNGYKPAPLDTKDVVVDDNLKGLLYQLAKNTHDIWACDKVSRGWTYGLNEDPILKRSPHLVPYDEVDSRIKAANTENAAEIIKTILLYGFTIDNVQSDHDEDVLRDTLSGKEKNRLYRAQKTYSVTNGKWYFELEVLTEGPMKVGWISADAVSDTDLGLDEKSFAFDGFKAHKCHQGSEPYGRVCTKKDVVGCFLDLNDRTISFSLNGELLLDSSGAEVAFDNIPQADCGFVPAFMLGQGQEAKLNFGQNVNSLKYFTTCGLQEGYEPFCVNMSRSLPLWYNRERALFRNMRDLVSKMEVMRIPASENNPPCLRLIHKLVGSGTVEKGSLQFLRLSLPVRTNSFLVKNKDRDAIHIKLRQLQHEHTGEHFKIRIPKLPKEFASELQGAVKASEEDGDRTKRRISKSQSLEVEEGYTGMPIRASVAHPASAQLTGQSQGHLTVAHLRVSSSEADIMDPQDAPSPVSAQSGIASMSASQSSTAMSYEAKRSRTPLRVFQTISQRVRDASASRGRRLPEEKEPLKGTMRPRTQEVSPKSIKTLEDTTLKSPHGKKSGGNRRVTMVPPIERPSHVNTSDDDGWAMSQLIDEVDEYYFGVRIFPGQDPAYTWVGWVRPQFHEYTETFSSSNVRCADYFEKDSRGDVTDMSFHNCYLVNGLELANSATKSEGASAPDSVGSSSKMSGLLIGCLIDVSTGELRFLANGKESTVSFKVEADALLYPAVFVAATSKEVFQFELGRVPFTLPLSSVLFKSSRKTITGVCPPRLMVQSLRPSSWCKVPTETLRVTSLKLSDSRGWSVLCDDPVKMLAVHIPEKDACMDVSELIESPEYLRFHTQTLHLYEALSAKGNFGVAKELTNHIDAHQFLYALQNSGTVNDGKMMTEKKELSKRISFIPHEYIGTNVQTIFTRCSLDMPGSLRCAFYDLLIAIHLEAFVEARKCTVSEYIIPLSGSLDAKDVLSQEAASFFPPVLGKFESIRPNMNYIAKSNLDPENTLNLTLRPPSIDYEKLKVYTISSLCSESANAVMNARDLIGGDTYHLFVPLLKLGDKLLAVGLLSDEEVLTLLKLLDPSSFDPTYIPGTTQKGLLEIELAEGVKLELCRMLSTMCDIQLRHRIESTIAYSKTYVGDLQTDQQRRYIEIKQSEDMLAAVVAKRTKEFRCPPKDQMLSLINFKKAVKQKDSEEEDVEAGEDESPMSEALQDQLRSFHERLVKTIQPTGHEETGPDDTDILLQDEDNWLDKMVKFMLRIPITPPSDDKELNESGQEKFRRMVVKYLSAWAKTSVIEDSQLVRGIFSLLLRQYDGINEFIEGLKHTYVIHERNSEDIVQLLFYLSHVRLLLGAQTEVLEEEMIRVSLWHIMNNNVFFQHPDLMRILAVHENVMSIITNILGRSQQSSEAAEAGETEALPVEIRDTSEMVVSCCKFLCYFCRTSRQNQKAMFEHLPFLLNNASLLLARPSLRGSVPLDVAYSSFMDNNELCLALKEDELDKVTVYLERCGLQSNAELVARSYPDIGWDPVEGERYLDFLRFCVWVNGENVEENANLVIRLLIRRPEGLGPALKGEGEGLLAAFKRAIVMSKEIHDEGNVHGGVYMGDKGVYPTPEDEGDDYLDMGEAILNFYSSLVDLLGKCAPDPVTVTAGKSESLRARAILRSLISLEDLEAILALKFTLPNLSATEGGLEGNSAPPGILPAHKQSILLFLERVYGIEGQTMFFKSLEQSFLPDLRCAVMLDTPGARESDMALALNRYLCTSVLPMMTVNAHLLSNADQYAALMDACLHAVYRMSKIPCLTNNQRKAVLDFLLAITRELHQSMLVKLLKKVVLDIPELNEYATVPLKLMTLNYERCGTYYSTQGTLDDLSATEEEKRLTMTLFLSIFNELGKKAYDPDLFGNALPCLIAIGSALAPDYTLTEPHELHKQPANIQSKGPWVPRPVDVTGVTITAEHQSLALKFAEHFHDSWARRKLDKGWQQGEIYSRTHMTHPRLKNFGTLKEYEKTYYKERFLECLKALLAWNFNAKLTDSEASKVAHIPQADTNQLYNPRPVDLSNMTLNRDMQNLAERMAENAHVTWCKNTFERLMSGGGTVASTMVQWDFLTDFERRKYRFMANECLRFLQYFGYTVEKESQNSDRNAIPGQNTERASVENRFAHALLDKLLLYLDNATASMHNNKPSLAFTRGSLFKRSNQDVKFFCKVVLPMMQAYFKAHKNYFLNSGSVSHTGVASNGEKEMVASLFCRLALLLRRKCHSFGSDAKIAVECLNCMVQSLDARSLVKMNSDTVRTGILMFFTSAAEDVIQAVKTVQNEGQYASIRGGSLKSWVSLEYVHQVLIPILTSLFSHFGKNNFGPDILIDEIQVSCYKIFDSLYSITSLLPSVTNRYQIKGELERHRQALGTCLSAFAQSFPIAFLEPEFNANNQRSVLAKFEESSVQAQDMLQSLSENIPQLNPLITALDTLALQNGKYSEKSYAFDVDLPLLCGYLSYWWNFGVDGPLVQKRQVTSVCNKEINKVFSIILLLIKEHLGLDNALWMCKIPSFAKHIVGMVSDDPLPNLMLPISEKIRKCCEVACREEDYCRLHPDEGDEQTIADKHNRLVRDTYSFFPLLIKFADQHRAQWLKSPSWAIDSVYENVAVIFKLWSNSQHFKREELNFQSQFGSGDSAPGEVKSGKAAIAERKKKRREGKKVEKEMQSIVVVCLKRMLPVGLSAFGGRELEIVHKCKEKFLQKINEDKIKEFIKATLAIPEKTDPTDKNVWQRNLYEKIGKRFMRDIDRMSMDEVVNKISTMGQVLSILHMLRVIRGLYEEKWERAISLQRKRLVTTLITSRHLHKVQRHNCINLFIEAYVDNWLADEDYGQDQLIDFLTQEDNEGEELTGHAVVNIPNEENEESDDISAPPDALTQMIRSFQMIATSESGASTEIADDKLLVAFEKVMTKSIHVDEEGEEDNEEEEPKSAAEAEQEQNVLREEQRRLASRGAAIMVLQYISVADGSPGDMVARTLELGINLLNGGNIDIQTEMLRYLKDKRDVRFFTSVSGLMSKCSVLNLEIFERQVKAEGLGMGAELAIGDNQNLNDSEFVCSLFRFIQLTCEGHNDDFQNYIRAQPGNTTSVNLVTTSVDYLLRLQESIMDFYWHYSSKETVDEGGKYHFLKAVQVCSQVFNTITEAIQGPCLGNQLALAHSRLWDAISGFFFLFAQMMDKLSKNATQLELLREFLNLQKDMIVLMLSMLEGNVLNGAIGRQMVDTLVECQGSLELILRFFDMFLKLKDLTTSHAFQEFDMNKDGWISSKEFLKAMEAQKMYSVEEINYLMMCTDVNNDGKIDYMEFTERFHNPAKDIGFNLAVLLTNIAEHTTNDVRFESLLEKGRSMLDHFEPYLGRIEIMGSSKRVEKVYFEIQEEWIEQLNKEQIKESKREFLHAIIAEGCDEKSKLEAFVDFCEDTIFEMEHAQTVSSEESDGRLERAIKQREIFMGEAISESVTFEKVWNGIKTATDRTVSFLRPSNLRQKHELLVNEIRKKTYGELTITVAKLLWKSSSTFIRFCWYLTTGQPDKESEPVAALPMPQQPHKANSTRDTGCVPDLLNEQVHPNFEAFGVPIVADDTSGIAGGQMHVHDSGGTSETNKTTETDTKKRSTSLSSKVAAGSKVSNPPSVVGPTGYGTSPPQSEIAEEYIGIYEPKIAESSGRSKGSVWYVFARNFYLLKRICSALTLMINIILLSYEVKLESGETGSETEDDASAELIVLPENKAYLFHVGVVMSIMHCIFAFAIVIAYYQLKMPLILFKTEKDIARHLMDGKWITDGSEEDEEEGWLSAVMARWNSLVVSAPTFPQLYWDKFVRKKAKDNFSEQFDPESLDKLLALDKDPLLYQQSADDTTFGWLWTTDWRYVTWRLGVIFSEGVFLYQIGYFICSFIGIFFPFFFAIHVIDVVLSSPMLQTILKAVTHNLSQLILTIVMTLVVVYLYTVLAFNVFRKFYVQEEDGDVERKCHDMWTCFVYHFYAGVRAGGGIGDELDAPFNDELMYPRIAFDISFFFFIIVILLAIMQGLIIDAFGELRDQLESVKDNLENNCFICAITKEYFDKYPHGFERHTEKDHNLANYLFFLMHLLNKDETEYTGQETYVHRMYQERCYDFFPMGEAFVKQYEEELMAAAS